ncbi:MAG TPA: FTR1 family protein [Thermoanaerobaculia bacterium]|nr:FTR1 family protein [Thermoanaerobaculia bacterium]
MLPALIIVFREGFEAFLTVAIILAFLRKTGRDWLRPAVYWGIGISVAASFGLAFLLMRVNQPFWEGVLGIVAAVLVASFVVHVWRTAPKMKGNVEQRLESASSSTSRLFAFTGVLLFSIFMITREGMEAALMLIQVRSNARFVAGALTGLACAAAMSWAWGHFGHLINLKRFFQVTGIFLLLFTLQIVLYSVHEFSEAGVLPNSETIHAATEIYGPEGLYGRWFSLGLVGLCAVWLSTVTIMDRMKSPRLAVRG